MNVFNGLKGFATLIMMWGLGFWLVQYSEIDNSTDLVGMLNSYYFTIFVASSVYTIPLFFFCSAFLQTFSFMNRPANLRFKT